MTLKGGVKKFMVVARGLKVRVKSEDHYFDYGGCLYPEGMTGDQLMYFQESGISRIIHKGYSDEDDRLMVENIQETFEREGYEKADVGSLKAGK